LKCDTLHHTGDPGPFLPTWMWDAYACSVGFLVTSSY